MLNITDKSDFYFLAIFFYRMCQQIQIRNNWFGNNIANHVDNIIENIKKPGHNVVKFVSETYTTISQYEGGGHNPSF